MVRISSVVGSLINVDLRKFDWCANDGRLISRAFANRLDHCEYSISRTVAKAICPSRQIAQFGLSPTWAYADETMSQSTFTPRYKRLLRSLTNARKDARLSQAKLALRLGRVQTFVSKYERGERRLDVVEFLDVAEALKLDPCELLRELRTKHG